MIIKHSFRWVIQHWIFISGRDMEFRRILHAYRCFNASRYISHVSNDIWSNMIAGLSLRPVTFFLSFLLLLFRDHCRTCNARETGARKREKKGERELLHLHLAAMHRRSVKAPLSRSITWQRETDNVALWSLTPTWLQNIRENVGAECWNILRNIISQTRVTGLAFSFEAFCHGIFPSKPKTTS